MIRVSKEWDAMIALASKNYEYQSAHFERNLNPETEFLGKRSMEDEDKMWAALLFFGREAYTFHTRKKNSNIVLPTKNYEHLIFGLKNFKKVDQESQCRLKQLVNFCQSPTYFSKFSLSIDLAKLKEAQFKE
uniref:Uncharacterized protein n=1 Tax=Romanomermis culicivorax TaxID=13658 RepID=A0A915KL89_ROMCU